MPFARDLALRAFRRLIRIFYRQIEVIGAPSAQTRGRLFAANHVNGLVDPIVVMTAVPAPISPIAKSTLWKIPGLRLLLDLADAVPVARKKDAAQTGAPGATTATNDESFDRVAAHLARGGNVLIFPEGISHSEPHVAPLKTGAARMLLRAHDLATEALTYQAVALEFDARETFRSRALVLHGPVRTVAAIFDDPKIAVESRARAITDQLASDLSELIVEGATWEERIVIGRVSELLARDASGGVDDETLATWSTIGRQVDNARTTIGRDGDAHYTRVAAAVNAYFAALEGAGVRDADVVREEEVHASGRLRRGVVLALLAPLALIGFVLYFVPYQLPRWSARWARGEGDVVSTLKLATGIFVFPLWALGLVVAVILIGKAHAWPALAAAMCAIFASPIAALVWLDRSDRFERARGLDATRALFGASDVDPDVRTELRALRAQATAAIAQARAFVEAWNARRENVQIKLK